MARPDMSRDKDLAGLTVSKGGYSITYDDNGYATKAVNNDGRVSAASVDAVTGGGGVDRGSYGGSVYDQQYFSNSELASAAEVRAAAEAGKTTWDDAHAYVEGIRANYGYSGDTDGSKYIPLALDEDRGGGFSYASAPTYTSRYQGQIDELTKQILNREAFSYNHEEDPTYQQYKKTYTREGQRAMQDTLGQVSARTGGLASSYAGSAAQQTYDNYMGELADKIPELRQLAYEMYMDEGDTQRANLEMLMALEQGDYAKYADLLAQYNTDRSFDYGVFSDDRAFDYQVDRDAVEDARYEDETDWERSQYTSEKEYNQALQKAQTLAAAGDFSGYKALGYSDAEIANLKAAYDKAQVAAKGTGSGSGGGNGGGGNGGGGDTGSGSGIVDTMLSFDSDTKAYEYLLGLGHSNAKTEQLWTLYEAAKEGGGAGAGDIPSFNDYSEAVAYMKQNGVPNGNASSAMTRSEWSRRKASYQTYGQGGTEVTEYDSYSDYLTAYVQYCIETYG